MDDNFINKVLKDAAKLGTSYMSTTADSLSKNDKFSEEQREQYRDISNAFSDMREKLNNKVSYSNYDYDEPICEQDAVEDYRNNYSNNHANHTDINNLSVEKHRSHSKKMKFAGFEWYVIQWHNSNNTALLLSKKIFTENMTFFPENCNEYTFENSNVYAWLNDSFLPKLKDRLDEKEKERLLSISLLSKGDISKIPFNATESRWWLKDIEDGKYLNYVSNSMHVQKVKINKRKNRCGIRPAILVKLKDKG